MKNAAPLILGIGVVGCSSGTGDFVKFDRLDVQHITWDDIDANFVFKIDNPNPIDIKLARFDYTLGFAGVDWLDGSDPDGLTLVGGTDNEIALPMNIVFQSLYDMVQADKGLDTIPFELSGSFGFDTPMGTVDLPYDANGDFPALRTPHFAFDKIHVGTPDWTNLVVPLEVDLGVENDHESNLLFQNFDYQLSLGGNDVAGGLVDDLGEALGATESTLKLPIDLSLVGAGAAAWDALQGNDVRIGLGAATDVDTPFGIVPLSIDESGNVSVN